MKRRVLLIYLSPLLVLLPILWLFGPDWAWQMQGEEQLQGISATIRWDEIAFEDAVAELNAILEAEGSSVRLKIDPNASSPPLSLYLHEIPFGDLVMEFSSLSQTRPYVTGPNSLRIGQVDPSRWSSRRAQMRAAWDQWWFEQRVDWASRNAPAPVLPPAPSSFPSGFGFGSTPPATPIGGNPAAVAPAPVPEDPFADAPAPSTPSK